MTPSTTRSLAAAEEIFTDGRKLHAKRLVMEFIHGTDGTGWCEGAIADIISKHYAELEAAAVLARDALKVAKSYVVWSDDEGRLPGDYPEAAAIVEANAKIVQLALSVINAAIGTTQRINTNVEKTDS